MMQTITFDFKDPEHPEQNLSLTVTVQGVTIEPYINAFAQFLGAMQFDSATVREHLGG